MSKKPEDSKKPDEVLIGSIDQGTTSTRFIIYDRSARAIGSHQVEFTQFYPEAGWVEHDAMEILESVRVCMAKALDKATADGHNVDSGLKAIGLTNQRETTLVWSKSTGCPLYNAIVWMDVRTSSICRKLEKELSGGRTHFVETCGLPISTYFSALKLLWLLENVDKVKKAVQSGDALFGTIDTWLIWNLTGGVKGGIHVTDVSNASRTMLMNLKTLEWDSTTLKTLGIPAQILPKIVSNSEVIGKINTGWPITGVPISGCLGDQHAAMLGQACRRGEAKSTYGTGAFILLNTGEEIIQSTHGLLSTLAFKLGPKAPTNYALEGSIAIAGAAVQWLRDSPIFLRRLLLPGVHHNIALRSTLLDYNRHWSDSDFHSLTADMLKKEILSLIEHEGVSDNSTSILCCWKKFCSPYFQNWCKSNALCGLLLDSYRGSFGLIRKNSVSLFRCSENIERLINGISGTSDDLIHLVTMEAGLILQLEVLVKMLRCVVNVSQQLGKTASAIFYESLVSAPLVISAEEITHRLLKNLESGYGSTVAMLHVSEHA